LKVLVELAEGAKMPRYATPDSAGMDLCAYVDVQLQPLERRLVPTGVKMVIPPGFEGQVRPRSGLALKRGIGMVNAPGTIDADYRGEIGVLLINFSDSIVQLSKGERIAQLVICPIAQANLERIEAVMDFPTARGEGGFGSTGK
jgi:dUTP pyrophosphatase